MHPRDGYEAGYRFYFPRWTPTVRALILLNVAVFLVYFFLVAFRVVTPQYVNDRLGVRADWVLFRGWVWQIVTYMFLHLAPLHILINMLMLYLFGTQMEGMLGRRRFLALYFGGGILGGIAYCGTQFLAPSIVPAIGASAAVMAVMLVCAIHFPNQMVFYLFVPLPLKWLVTFLIALDLLYSIAAYKDGVAHIAHLGGALYGYLFWRFGPAVKQVFDRRDDRRRERRAERLADDERYMDELLAKISREGFDSLTRREREFLTRQSRKRRERGYRD